MRNFGEILAENRKKKGYSQSDLVDLLSQEGIQVTTKAISKWETNAREPALHVFLTLCQLLDIEDIYESFFGENPYNIMSGLNEEGRNKLIEFADILKASKKFSPLSAKIIPFHHPVEITWEPVSAGTGNYLEDSVKETYDVGHLAPEQTDFGVRISGDSMEPLYHTGVHHSYTACLSAGASLDFQNSVDVIFSSILPCKKYGNQLSVFPELCHYIYIYFVHADTSL